MLVCLGVSRQTEAVLGSLHKRVLDCLWKVEALAGQDLAGGDFAEQHVADPVVELAVPARLCEAVREVDAVAKGGSALGSTWRLHAQALREDRERVRHAGAVEQQRRRVSAGANLLPTTVHAVHGCHLGANFPLCELDHALRAVCGPRLQPQAKVLVVLSLPDADRVPLGLEFGHRASRLHGAARVLRPLASGARVADDVLQRLPPRPLLGLLALRFRRFFRLLGQPLGALAGEEPAMPGGGPVDVLLDEPQLLRVAGQCFDANSQSSIDVVSRTHIRQLGLRAQKDARRAGDVVGLKKLEEPLLQLLDVPDWPHPRVVVVPRRHELVQAARCVGDLVVELLQGLSGGLGLRGFLRALLEHLSNRLQERASVVQWLPLQSSKWLINIGLLQNKLEQFQRRANVQQTSQCQWGQLCRQALPRVHIQGILDGDRRILQIVQLVLERLFLEARPCRPLVPSLALEDFAELCGCFLQ
mmetsp:Transcript_103925/g.269063  ORF Transcript_103925/g.269063 Transcript_103925/m.269063 type:complete len:473 (-) Transcript_103925:6681-8099(-)